MSTLYSWIADKKAEAMKQKLQERGLPNYRQLPIREKYGVSFTGYGPDGKLQSQNPMGTDGKHVWHEGEMKADMPEGSMYVDAKTTGMAFPETQQQQSDLADNSRGLPGYSVGGWAKNAVRGILTAMPKQNNNYGTQSSLGSNSQTRISNPVTVTPATPTIESIKPQANQQQIVQPKLAAQVEPTQPSITKIPIPASTTKIPIPSSTNTGIATKTVEPQTNTIIPIKSGNQIEADRIAAEQKISDEETERSRKELGDWMRREGKTTEEPTIEEKAEVIPETPVEPSIEDKSRQGGMQWLLDALNKENPALRLEGQRAVSELSSKQQQERSAMEQQLLQQGVDPGRARLEGQMLRDKQESEVNDLAAKYGIAGMQARQEIAGTLASQGLAGQQFEAQEKQYKDSADWKSYEAAIAAGDFDTAAKAYQRTTGQSIDMTQMKAYQTYLNTKRGQDVVSGDLANDSAKFNLDSARMQSMISDINNGVPLDTVNKTYGTSLDQSAYDSIGEKYQISMQSLRTRVGSENIDAISAAIGKGASLEQINSEFPNAKLTMNDYKAMMDATPLGERTWERNMSYAKTLLEAGGAENITAAAGIFNQAFPGTGIDFSKLITADNAATVNKGMSQLSDLVASGMDYDAAIAVMKKNGTLDMMGMDETEVEKVYRGMKVNAIDEQWNAISDSEWYKGLDAEKQKDMSDFFTAVLSGELDYSVQKEYSYVDASGKTVTKNFATEGEAADFATQNKVKLTATGKSTVVPRTTTTDETGGTVVTPPSGRTEPLGTTIIENGKIYQVIADGKTQEITPDVDDPWSDNNSKVLKAGEKDNPYYKTIIDARYKEVTDDGKLLTTPWKWDTLKKNEQLKDLAYDDPLIQKIKTEFEAYAQANPVISSYLVNGQHVPVYFFIVKDGNSWKQVSSTDKNYKG